jgi:AsmA protein
MSLTKKILLAVAGLVLIVLAGVAWLVLSFDANRYKSVAIDWVQQHKQRTLAIGDVQLKVLPRLQVELSQVALSEFKQPQQPFVQLESARLTVQLLPLLKKQLVVDEVAAQGLQLHYSRDEAGKSNIDDLLQPAKPDTPAQPQQPDSGAPLLFNISSIDLKNLQLQLDDSKGHLHGKVTLASLNTGRLSPDVLTPISLAADVQLSEPKLAAQLHGSLQLMIDLGQADAPEKRALKLAANKVELNLGLQMGALDLKDSRLSLERFDLAPAEQKLALDQLGLLVQGALGADKGPGQPFKVELNWPKLAIQGQQLQGSALSGSFALQGPAALQGTLSSGAPSGSFEAIKVPAFKLALGAATSGAGASRVNGTVQTDISALTKTSQVTLDALSIDASVHNPALQPLKITAKGKVEASPKTSHWQLAGQMNAQAFNTDGQITLGGKVPQLQAQARFGELDLDALLPPRPAADSTPATAKPEPAADVPVDLAGLRAIDAKVSLQAGLLKYKPFVVRDLVASAALDNGRLLLALFSLKTWDGALDARVTADAGQAPAQQRIAVLATAQNILIQALLKDVATTDLLEGRGLVKLDVQTGGASVNAFKAALDGTAALQLRDGAVKGINLAQKLREFKATLSTSADANQKANQVEKTDFSELNASFQIKNGVAESHDLDLKSPFLRLGGDGQIDLPKSTLDYTARTTLANTTKGQGGAAADALSGLTVPVQLQGPFAALDWHIRWSQVAFGGTSLKQAGDQLKTKAEDKAKARLAEKLGLKASDAASAPLREQVKEKATEKATEALQNKLKGLFGK